MNAYESLEDEARKDSIDIIPYNFRNDKLKGLYCDGVIGLNKDIDTTTEKACILAEELGHHYTTVGNILDLEDPANRKQERRARLWGYDRLIGLHGIINAYEAGCRSSYEIAEYLGVTEEYLQECIGAYREKYGTGARIGEYYVMFEPRVAVGRMM